MIDFNELLKKVESSKVYKHWKNENKNSFLCSFFNILSQDNESGWQVYFYNEDNDSITSFLAEDNVEIIENGSKVFKEPGTKVDELKLKNIKIMMDKAFGIFEKQKLEKYPKENASKKIIILQKIKIPLWNITYITSGFKTLNIKIDAENGKIIEESLTSILSSMKKA